MASPGSVVIQFLVDSKNAAKGAADLAKNFGKVDKEADSLDATLDGLDRELDTIGRASQDLGDDMKKAGVGFDTVGDEADQAAARVRLAARQMADGVHDGGTKIDAETDGIRRSMADTGREAGAEMIQNIGESIGSGTGSITDTIQGTLGGLTNMAASIPGPFGLAFGAVSVAAGVMFASVTKEAEATKARIASMTQALIDMGETASDAARQAMWDAWNAELEEGSTTIDDITDGLRDAGLKEALFKDAITGSVAAQKQILSGVDAAIGKLETQKEKQGGIGFLDAERLRKLKLIRAEIDGGTTSIEDAQDELRDLELLTGDAADAAKEWRRELDDVKEVAAEIDDALRGIPDQEIVVRLVGPDGHPFRPDKVMPGMVSTPAGVATFTAPASQATPVFPPMTVNVQLDQWGNARITKRALEADDRRQGRRPGTPLRVAW